MLRSVADLVSGEVVSLEFAPRNGERVVEDHKFLGLVGGSAAWFRSLPADADQRGRVWAATVVDGEMFAPVPFRVSVFGSDEGVL